MENRDHTIYKTLDGLHQRLAGACDITDNLLDLERKKAIVTAVATFIKSNVAVDQRPSVASKFSQDMEQAYYGITVGRNMLAGAADIVKQALEVGYYGDLEIIEGFSHDFASALYPACGHLLSAKMHLEKIGANMEALRVQKLYEQTQIVLHEGGEILGSSGGAAELVRKVFSE